MNAALRKPGLTARGPRGWWLVGLPLVLLSCEGNSPLVPLTGPGTTVEYAGGAVQLTIRESPGPSAGLMSYTVSLEARRGPLGAYQGDLTFVPGALDIVSVTSPGSGDREYHLLNTDLAEGGRIRFAAFSVAGFASEQVLTMVARPRGANQDPRLAVQLETIAGVNGAPFAEAAAGGRPLFSPAANMLVPDYIGFNPGSSAQVRVSPGATVSVPLTVDLSGAGTLNLASLQSTVSWVPAVLTFNSLQPSVPAGWTFSASTGGAANGTVGFSAGGASPLAATTTLATVNFTASNNVGGTMLYLSPAAAANAQGASILARVRASALAVCVAPPAGRWGDANDDGAVNITDAQQIARYDLGLSVANLTAVTTRGDVTADGAVNIVDAQQIARYDLALSAAARTGTPVYAIPATDAITLISVGVLAVGASVQFILQTSSGSVNTTGCSTVTWTSSDPAVAIVNETGLVSGIAPGTATITVTSNTASRAVEVTVS